MPFEPLTPEEQKGFPTPCVSREHYPPTHMVIREPMKWVCPNCGMATILSPSYQVSMSCRAPQTLAEYDAQHDNGCSICRDPNCSNPGGKH